MKTNIIRTFAFVLSSIVLTFAQPITEKSSGPTRNVTFTIESTYGGPLRPFGEELNVAKNPDYAGLIAKVAEGSEEALATFFEVSNSSPFDAASGEAHQCTVKRVLLHWGDFRFAKVLSKQPLDIRMGVARWLGAETEEFRLLFPLTYAASTGQDAAVPAKTAVDVKE